MQTSSDTEQKRIVAGDYLIRGSAYLLLVTVGAPWLWIPLLLIFNSAQDSCGLSFTGYAVIAACWGAGWLLVGPLSSAGVQVSRARSVARVVLQLLGVVYVLAPAVWIILLGMGFGEDAATDCIVSRKGIGDLWIGILFLGGVSVPLAVFGVIAGIFLRWRSR